jgi:recombination protein RecR
MIFSSQLIEDAVNAFCKLPGIGKKTALRMVLHLLKEEEQVVEQFGEAVIKMRKQTCFCTQCNNISDGGLCAICNNPMRNKQIVCVVENIRDVITIESTGQYNGLYHVLGGLLSPLDGIGPDRLFLHNIESRVKDCNVEEMIMALSPTIEGDTTVYFIAKLLKDSAVKITSIARGVSFGGELEYTDEFTLGRAIAKRLPVENYVNVSTKK